MLTAKPTNTLRLLELDLIQDADDAAIQKIRCVDVKGLAALLSVSPRTIRHWAADPADPLPAITKKGKTLFRIEAVAEWLDDDQPGRDDTTDNATDQIRRHKEKLQ